MKTSLASFLDHFQASMRVHSLMAAILVPLPDIPSDIAKKFAHKFELSLLTQHKQYDWLHLLWMT